MKIIYGDRKIDFTFTMLCVSIVGIAVNYSIAGPLRLTDICLLLAFISLIATGSIKKDVFWVIVAILGFLITSLVVGVWKMGIRQPNNIFFIYKFIFPFLPAIIMYSIKWDSRKLRLVHKLSLGTFIFLTAWVYIYMVLKFLGMPGNWRPKWPFSSEVWGSDAHLYSAFLAIGLIFLRSYWRKIIRMWPWFVNFLSVATIIGMVLTGSRTGLVILFAYFGWSILADLRIPLVLRRRHLFILPLVGIAIVASIVFLVNLSPETREQLSLFNTVTRAFDFNLAEDDSANARAIKFLSSFQQSAKTNFIFGPGALAMQGNWYDGYIPQVNVLMGGLGLIFMLLLPPAIIFKHYLMSKKTNTSREFFVFATVLSLYFLANFITEYFLVTRSIAPVSIFLSAVSLVIYGHATSLYQVETEPTSEE